MPNSQTAAAWRIQDDPPPIGLAALTRMAMRGENLAGVAQGLVARLNANSRDASAFLDLSTIEQLLGARENRMALQMRALDIRRVFASPGNAGAPTLLMLAAPGDFMANTPFEFLVEGGDCNIVTLYVDAATDIAALAPPHDAVFNAVAESVENQPILAAIAGRLANWPRPVINPPHCVAPLTRDGAWRLLHDAPGLIYPCNERISRAEAAALDDFPLILRPVDSHAGADLEKIEDDSALSAYLAAYGNDAFYTAPFIDYRGPDRMFRKMRIAVIAGAPFPVHLAVSPRWMVHYLNAEMLDSAENRAEEARFFAGFATFAARHAQAFQQMHERLGLDYFQIDCAEVDDKLLIFEVGSAMIAHDLDDPDVFPYKGAPMRTLFSAFQALLSRACAQGPASAASAPA